MAPLWIVFDRRLAGSEWYGWRKMIKIGDASPVDRIIG